jgi:hypothetical protein
VRGDLQLPVKLHVAICAEGVICGETDDGGEWSVVLNLIRRWREDLMKKSHCLTRCGEDGSCIAWKVQIACGCSA